MTQYYSDIGKRFWGNELTKRVANSWGDNASLLLPAGTYIVEGNGNIANPDTTITIKLNAQGEIGRQSVYAKDGNTYSAKLTVVTSLSSETTVTLQSWCSKAFDANGFGISATKLK